MFLTIASARLPCCTTLSRLPCRVSAISLISLRNLASRVHPCKRLPQFVNEFDRDGREIVDEIERILDLVRDAGSQLTKRCQLLGLNQTVLCGPQVLQRFASSRVRVSTLSNKRAFWIASTDCAANVLIKSTVFCGKAPGVLRRTTSNADDIFPPQQRRYQQRAETGALDNLDNLARSRGCSLPQVGHLDRLA
jgi:hypothetical protein